LNIVLVNSSDRGGGAEKIATEMLRHLVAQGRQAWLTVGRRQTIDERVVQLQNDVEPGGLAGLCSRLGARLQRASVNGSLSRRVANLISNRVAEPMRSVRALLGHEDFDFPCTRSLLNVGPVSADLVHCHNLHGGYFDLRFLADLSHRLPVVLTMHDAWLLSGHCAHSFACDRWKAGCGQCPDLTIYPEIRRDATAYNWRRKRDIYAASRLYVATPSRWLMDKVEQSMLAPAIEQARVIPNGIDISLYCPGDRRTARQRLGLPMQAKIVMFAANGIRRNQFKDFETLRAALAKLGESALCDRVLCIALGEDSPSERYGAVEIRFIPYQTDEAVVVDYYRAADVYVHAARADTFPTTVLEAAACETPVIATAVGGIVEQIQDEVTGFLVPPGDPDALARRMQQLLADDAGRESMGRRAAERAAQMFDVRRMVDDYVGWYSTIIERASSAVSKS
jgi:glycosyltransferase involved in cell wall biosynthesis